jgi:hypothetical protein
MSAGAWIAAHQHLSSSLPGLTRQSMLRLNFYRFAGEAQLRRISMDARVKPAHDEDWYQTNKDQA